MVLLSANFLSLVISNKWACGPFILSPSRYFFHDLYYYCVLICDVFCMDTIMDFSLNCIVLLDGSESFPDLVKSY